MSIPHVVHRIWFGPHTPPDNWVEYGKAWSRLNPGWRVKLWTEDNLPPLVNQDVYDQLGHCEINSGSHLPELGKWVQRADVVAYELIWRYGGVYANCDLEPLKPLAPLLSDVEAFAAYEDPTYLCNAFMGCTANHPFYKAVIDLLPLYRAARAGLQIPLQTGPHLLTHVHRTWPWPERVATFPRELIYPVHFTELEQLGDPHPDAYTLHHWGHQTWRPDHVAS